MSVRNSSHVVQVRVDAKTWRALGFEGARRDVSSRARILLSLAEAGGLDELRKKVPADQ